MILSLLLSCGRGSYQETEQGIIISLPPSEKSGPLMIKIEVEEENIFRVSAVPEKNFPERTSLSVLPQSGAQVPFSVNQLDDMVEISTQSISAIVCLSDGQITFKDSQGNILLQEVKGGGKSFTPIEADHTTGYSFRQLFESPEDEAFFGLGQHQSDEWNYKGKNEVLYQYNTKVSIPFVLSNKNYGILWDNYSLTKFGDIRDYQELSQFSLFDVEGKEGGLTASYIIASGEIFTVRSESEIDYENLETIKKFPEGFPFGESFITWEGEIEPAESGVYEFKLYYAGYTKVFVDGVEVVPERWRTAWNPNTL